MLVLDAHTFQVDGIPAGATVLFNITGSKAGLTDMSLTSLVPHRERVLFNFPQATTLSFAAFRSRAASLAPSRTSRTRKVWCGAASSPKLERHDADQSGAVRRVHAGSLIRPLPSSRGEDDEGMLPLHRSDLGRNRALFDPGHASGSSFVVAGHLTCNGAAP